MSHPSHTSINIARRTTRQDTTSPRTAQRYEHFFRVVVDCDPKFCSDVIDTLRMKFPQPAYAVTVTFWECLGYAVDAETCEVNKPSHS